MKNVKEKLTSSAPIVFTIMIVFLFMVVVVLWTVSNRKSMDTTRNEGVVKVEMLNDMPTLVLVEDAEEKLEKLESAMDVASEL